MSEEQLEFKFMKMNEKEYKERFDKARELSDALKLSVGDLHNQNQFKEGN